MDFDIKGKQDFNGQIYKVLYNGIKYFIGVGNLHENIGMSVYFPQAGCNYFIVMLNDNNYRFHLNKFKSEAGLEYIAEKLGCSLEESKLVYNVVRHILTKDAAVSLLKDEFDNRNVLINDNIPSN